MYVCSGASGVVVVVVRWSGVGELYNVRYLVECYSLLCDDGDNRVLM